VLYEMLATPETVLPSGKTLQTQIATAKSAH
jgi:hypothetical protein